MPFFTFNYTSSPDTNYIVIVSSKDIRFYCVTISVKEKFSHKYFDPAIFLVNLYKKTND